MKEMIFREANPIYKEVDNLLKYNGSNLVLFTISYLYKHTYIKSKQISRDFLLCVLNLEEHNRYLNDYFSYCDVNRISRKFGRILTQTEKLNITKQYNSSTFKVIDRNEEKITELKKVYKIRKNAKNYFLSDSEKKN